MRLFVALEISAAIRDSIDKLIREWKPLDDSWKWTRAQNLHVTLKFLGETPQERIEKIVTALRALPFERPFTMTFRGLGFFPNERRPRVLWIGMNAPESLPALAKRIDEAVRAECLQNDEREFTPHLTLARSKDGRISPTLREAVARNSGREFGTMEAWAFHLVQSELKSSGAEYTTLASFLASSKTA